MELGGNSLFHILLYLMYFINIFSRHFAYLFIFLMVYFDCFFLMIYFDKQKFFIIIKPSWQRYLLLYLSISTKKTLPTPRFVYVFFKKLCSLSIIFIDMICFFTTFYWSDICQHEHRFHMWISNYTICV